MNDQVNLGANGESWQKAGWTLRYPELGTGPVSYENSISPEFYESEREAVFRRRWLNVGHISDLPTVGSYFTKELPVCRTSIIVVRGKDDSIRAFHNICPHRGNKLVWRENPMLEASGSCRLFRCKYHGWTFDLTGACHNVTDEAAFFDLDKSKLGLSGVHCSVWKGWIFVNFADKPAETLEESLGELGAGLEGFPMERVTTQYKYRAEVNCNWKVVYDAFLETYHAAYLHGALRSDIEHKAVPNHAIHFDADSKWNRKASFFGSYDPAFRTPVQRILGSDLFGPVDAPDFGYPSMQDLPRGLNPTRDPNWGLDSISFYPNFEVLVWRRNWVIAHRFWPLSYDRTQFDMDLCFVPPKNARQRLAQELSRVTIKDFALQDVNLLAGTFQMLQSRARTHFYLGDEEFMVRHLHSAVAQDVSRYRATLGNGKGVGK